MVELTDLPIEGKMRKQFEDFFKNNGRSYYRDWKFEGITHTRLRKPLIKQGFDGHCAICNTPIRRVCVVTMEKFRKGIGIICCSNLLAMKRHEGINNLNYARKVELEKRTLMKQYAEVQKQLKIEKLQKEFKKELGYCDNFLAKAETQFPEVFSNNRYASKIFRDHISLLKNFIFWINEGTANEFFVKKVQDAIKEKTVKQRLADLEKDYKQFQEKQKYFQKLNKDNEKYIKIIAKIRERCRLGNYDADFVKSLYDWGMSNRKTFTENQRKAIDKLAHRYRKQLESIGEVA